MYLIFIEPFISERLDCENDFWKEKCFYLWIENGLNQLNPNPYRQMRDNPYVKNHPDNKLFKVIT